MKLERGSFVEHIVTEGSVSLTGGNRDNSTCLSQGPGQQGNKGKQIDKREHGADSHKVHIGA